MIMECWGVVVLLGVGNFYAVFGGCFFLLKENMGVVR